MMYRSPIMFDRISLIAGLISLKLPVAVLLLLAEESSALLTPIKLVTALDFLPAMELLVLSSKVLLLVDFIGFFVMTSEDLAPFWEIIIDVSFMGQKSEWSSCLL